MYPYFWSFVHHRQIKNSWQNIFYAPVVNKESDAILNDLKKRGMKFVGSTIIYAYMQAVGLINDHVAQCWKFGK
ncbi:DNA-3-methyladenine glycosylase I [Candidatus Babeliales bacterium]|nr:DNA-3-methyladenine glycosylase I [Candidatus Babeliales bacterium]MBP9843920.1 DNA-3-methyladenine glycosylase I [Candidatus Babeliales bacterium]